RTLPAFVETTGRARPGHAPPPPPTPQTLGAPRGTRGAPRYSARLLAPASDRHDAVLLPGALERLRQRHCEAADRRAARLARIDHVVDQRGAGGHVGVDQLAELLDAPRALLLGAGRGGDLPPEDDVGPALGDAHPGLGRRPADDQVGLVSAPAHDEGAPPVGLPEHDRELRHRRLAHRVEHLGAVTDDAGALALAA